MFNFDEFTKNENILTKIRKRLFEELKKYENFTFVYKFVRIEIDYIIHHSPEGLVNFDEFTKNENILTKIRKRLFEELKKYENFTFVYKFVRIEIDYIIHHSPEGLEKAEKSYYQYR